MQPSGDDLVPSPATTPATIGWALVTGASSGIGEAIAREYAGRGKSVILTARREDRLQALARQLRKQVEVEVIVADLSERDAPAYLFERAQSLGLHVDTLVNNAGYGVPGRFSSSDWKTHADFLQVLVVAVTELTYRFLPPMETARFGRILNVASLAGLVPASAGHTLYGAAKSFVIRFSESLGHEVRSRGIHVTALCPGFTYSEFHDSNGMREKVSRLPKTLWRSATQVAKIGVDAVEAGKARVVTGGANRAIAVVSKLLPDALTGALISSRSRDFRDAD